MAKFSGAATVLVATTAAVCGLFALSEIGTTASGDTIIPVVAPDPTVSSTEPAASTTTTSTSTSTSTTSTTSTSTTSTSTTSTTTTTTAVEVPMTVAPASVTASSTFVGAGGVVTFDGTCDIVGPVFVQFEGPTTGMLDIGAAGPVWSYTWSAPIDDADIGTFTFRFFCGTPIDFTGTYPVALERRVDMVAVAAPTTTALVESQPPIAELLPETG